MVHTVTIAVDAMSGDRGVDVTVPAAVAMLKKHADLNLILVGRKEIIEPKVDRAAVANGRLQIQDAREIVEMDEAPADALRKKKDSSMRVSINLVKDGNAGACISAGNTGALMATGRFVLKTVPGIDRPAIMARMPTKSGQTYMLDLGANSDCTAEQLFQFGVMGSVVVQGIDNIERPRVALLNIGEEAIKGNDVVREAAALLGDTSLNYTGFVEGNSIADGVADVVVCDGFNGNVALKIDGRHRATRAPFSAAGIQDRLLRQARRPRRMARAPVAVAARRSASLQRREPGGPERHRRQESRQCGLRRVSAGGPHRDARSRQ